MAICTRRFVPTYHKRNIKEVAMKTFFITVKRFLLLSLILIVSLLFFYFHLYEYLNLKTIQHYQDSIRDWTLDHYALAVVIYIAAYSLLVACAIPCANLLNLFGGFLFGLIALIYAMVSTTLGGLLLFLAVRSAFGSRIVLKSGGWLKRIKRGLHKNAFNYLLLLRLVPVFPCWLSNIGAGIFNIPLQTFLSATIIGIFPATLIFVLVGRGIHTILNNHTENYSQLFLTPSILFPCIGLIILILTPMVYPYIKHKIYSSKNETNKK